MPKSDYGSGRLGVDYSVPPHEQPPEMLSDAQNVVVNDSGLITGRDGTAKLNTTAAGGNEAYRMTSFFEQRDGASVRNQIASYDTKVGFYNSATNSFDDKITGLTHDKMWQWTNFGGYAIGVNEGSDLPQYFLDSSTSGSLADLGDTPPRGHTVVDWSNRLWFGGDTNAPAKLTGSKLNDLTNYTATGATGAIGETVGDSGDPITGLFGFFDWLIIGKRNNLYKLTGSPATDSTTIAIEPIYSKASDNIGITSPWAIAQVGRDVLFMDGYDIRSLKAVQEYGDVDTTSIIPQFRDYLRSVADSSRLQYTQFFHYKKKKQVWVSVPTGMSTHFVFCLDYQFRDQTGRYSFFPMANLSINVFGGVENGEVDDMYLGDESGFVRKYTGNDDDSAAISRYFVNTIAGNNLPEGIATYHERRKKYNHIEAFFKSEESVLSMTPSYAIDLMDDEQVRASGNYTSLDAETVTGWQGTGVYRKRIRPFGLAGNTLSLKWTHSTTGQNFVCYPSNINYTPLTITQIV